MPEQHVDYDLIASQYNRRFEVSDLTGIASALIALARRTQARRILEVGCGTGRWLAELRPVTEKLNGLDLSRGMLRQARKQDPNLGWVQGRAEQIPYAGETFDLVYSVNATHHFDQPREFIFDSARLLRAGGALAVIGMDPHRGQNEWYVYQYFQGTLETDLARFPSREEISSWMEQAGFEQITWHVVERIRGSYRGAEVFADPFLQKNSTSQLFLLSQTAYQAGLERMRQALQAADKAGETLVFEKKTDLYMTAGFVPNPA